MSRHFINLKNIIKKIKKVDEAVIRYLKLGKIPAMPYRAFLNVADYFFIKGNFEQAEELLISATDFVSTSSDAIINLGTLKQSQGDIDKAFEYYTKALKKEPKNVKALCMLGNCYSFKKEIDKAIEKYQKAIEIDPRNADAYLCWGINLLKQDKYTEALDKFQKASEYNPKDAKAMFMYASVEIELGKYDEALNKFMFIINSTENNFGAYHNIAYIYFKKKEYKKTILYANKALQIMPYKLESYLLLGDSYLNIDQVEMALNTFQTAENKNIKSMYLYLSWGTALQKTKRYVEAIEIFNKGIEIRKNIQDEEIYARLSECYFMTGDVENAKIMIQKAFDIAPNNTVAGEVLAKIHILEENYEEAIKVLEKCLTYTDDKSSIYCLLGKCYKVCNDIDKSNWNYEKSLEYNRENKRALLEYTDSLNLQQKYNKALAKLRILESLFKEDYDVLYLAFKVNYNIAKDDIYAYNKVKAIKIAELIKEKYPEKYDIEDKYLELRSRE